MSQFSKNEAIEIAIQIEREGQQFFQAVADAAKDEEVKSVFEWLASEEQRHMMVFENMRNEVDRLQLAGPYDWEEAGRYLRTIAEERVFPGLEEAQRVAKGMTNLTRVFRFAIQIERDNILYFHELRDMIAEKDREIITKLIDEEKSHIRRLMELRGKMVPS